MTDEHITAYLLGELSEEESERFEEECFAQENWPAQIDSVEEDLIDDYLRRELSPRQRQSFENNYLTTVARMERVRMAAALLGLVAPAELVLEPASPDPKPAPDPPPVPPWRERLRAVFGDRPWVPAAALAALALIAAALIIPLLSRSPTFASLTLAPGVSDRAEGVQGGRVKLRPTDDELRLSLVLPAGTPEAGGYRAELESAGGAPRSLKASRPEGGAVPVVIPAGWLARGPYALRLFAVQPDGREQRITGSYFFTVD